jgi:hypothetical protein
MVVESGSSDTYEDFLLPRGRSTKDFVNDCDEMWYLMTDKERMNLYLKYN